jgi:flagellar hook-length control protein FliK
MNSSVAAPLVGTPTVQGAPTPADKPAPTPASPGANRFAELLRRNRAEAPKPATAASAQAAPVESPRTAAADDASAPEAKAAPANSAKSRVATTRETTGKPSVDGSEQGTGKSDIACRDDRADESDRVERTVTTIAPADPSRPSLVAPALEAMRRLATSPAASGDTTVSAGDDRDASAVAGTATKDTLGHARGIAAVDAANDRRAAPIDASRDAAPRVAVEAHLRTEPAEALRSLDSPAAAAAHVRAIDALSASLGLGTPLPGVDPALAPNPAPALALATPVDAPDFAAALGVRVSLLAQDGVQRAELHLNPAETGPVSIHISLDGTAARVDFGADVAATRAAIERGLPELASALRDAGFTLAGGGVSQHAGGRAGSDGETGRSGPSGAGPVSTSIATDSRTVVRRLAAGGVDLYA